jgi:4-hydroxybenzoate polyprenyltransferase
METRISIGDFFKLIRWKNLLMIFLTQFIVKYLVIDLIRLDDSIGHGNSPLVFLCLSLSTILIASSGYLLNNIVDIKTDIINNKMDSITIIKDSNALLKIYYAFNLLALFLSTIPTLFSENFINYLIFPFTILLLFIYSKYLKSTVLLGNILVSILSALSIILIPLFESTHVDYVSLDVFNVILIYSIFAFLVSMMREIVKDIEDIEGDFSTGLVTLPIRYGKEIAKKIALLFGVGTLLVIAYFLYPKRYDEAGFYYVLSIGIVLFSLGIISMLFIYKAQSKKDYSRSSLFLKIWMLVGILSMCFIPKFI